MCRLTVMSSAQASGVAVENYFLPQRSNLVQFFREEGGIELNPQSGESSSCWLSGSQGSCSGEEREEEGGGREKKEQEKEE